MRKVLFLATTLVLLVTVGIVVVAQIPAEPGLPTDVRTLLDQYLAYTYAPGTVNRLAVERASWPGHLDRAMGYQVFGQSVIYQTDTGPAGYETGGARPLPYPPEDLWCVLLERDGTFGPHLENRYDVAFVALHMDIHNADLMVHTGPQTLSDGEAEDLFATFGCQLELD